MSLAWFVTWAYAIECDTRALSWLEVLVDFRNSVACRSGSVPSVYAFASRSHGKTAMSKRYIAFWVITPFGIVGCVWSVAVLTPTDVSGAAQVVQAVLVGSAVVVGSTLAAVRLGLFREFEPHVVVDQEVSHRSVSESYVHVSCAVTIRNTSKVVVRISRADFALSAAGLFDDDGIEILHDRGIDRQAGGQFKWPMLDSFVREWSGEGLVIEPGSVVVETSEFIVGRDIRSLMVYSHFENRTRRPSRRGWYATTFYDLVERSID